VIPMRRRTLDMTVLYDGIRPLRDA
jgi:hypothetical protein